MHSKVTRQFSGAQVSKVTQVSPRPTTKQCHVYGVRQPQVSVVSRVGKVFIHKNLWYYGLKIQSGYDVED
jgi:hypothetical protein